MQEKFGFWVVFFVFMGAFLCNAVIPSNEEAKRNLSDLPFFNREYLDSMCNMHDNEKGFSNWLCAFPTIYNSDLSDEKRFTSQIWLLILGINQVTSKDIGLINIIEETLDLLTEEEKCDLERNASCTFQELKTAFRSNSASSSPVGSSDSEE